MSGEEGDAGFGEAEAVAEEVDEGLIGSAVDGRGGEGDFKGVVVDTGDGVFAGSGMDANGEGGSVGGVVGEGAHDAMIVLLTTVWRAG